MKLLTYFHDPDSLFVPILENIKIPSEVKGTTIAVSPSTTEASKKLIRDLGFEIIQGGLYGEARISLLKHAVANDYYLLCDFDKLLHWIDTNPTELLSIIEYKPTEDYTCIARSTRALATYPETWLKTEAIASRIMKKLIKKSIDFMNGPLLLSNRAVEIISKKAIEKGVGSCAEFCLLVHQANLSIGNIEVDGLTWEDPDRYVELIQNSTNFDTWKYDTFHSLYEWRKRVDFLNTQVQVMIRLTEEPINPKYPSVHNEIFSPID